MKCNCIVIVAALVSLNSTPASSARPTDLDRLVVRHQSKQELDKGLDSLQATHSVPEVLQGEEGQRTILDIVNGGQFSSPVSCMRVHRIGNTNYGRLCNFEGYEIVVAWDGKQSTFRNYIKKAAHPTFRWWSVYTN